MMGLKSSTIHIILEFDHLLMDGVEQITKKSEMIKSCWYHLSLPATTNMYMCGHSTG
jgi:hypothetical protein